MSIILFHTQACQFLSFVPFLASYMNVELFVKRNNICYVPLTVPSGPGKQSNRRACLSLQRLESHAFFNTAERNFHVSNLKKKMLCVPLTKSKFVLMLCVLQLAIAVEKKKIKSKKIKQANCFHDILAQLVNIVSMDHVLMVS